MIDVTFVSSEQWVMVRVADGDASISLLIPRPKHSPPTPASARLWPTPTPAPAASKRSPATTAEDEPWTEWLRKLSGGH